MKDVPENELLSAYLDGELTAAEQAEVEQLLAASPAARQLVDELRALSSSLQALPTYQIGEDISEQVLRLADETQRGPGPAHEKPEGARGQSEGPVCWAIVRRLTRPRNLVWAGAAAAAALLLVVVQWGQLLAPDRGEIAMETVADDGPAAASRPAAPIEAGEQAEAEMAAEYPLDAESAPRAMKRGRDDFVADKAGPRDATSASVPAAPPALAANERPMMRKPARAPASPGGTGGALGGMGMGRRVAKQSDAIEGQRPARDMPSKDQPKYLAKKGEPSAELVEREPSTGAKADQPPPGGQRPEPALVVSCWGTPAALQELAFERLLEEQGVRRVATAGPEVDAPAPAPASQPGKAAWYGAQAKPPGVRQVVEVEATRDQLRGLMLSVQRQSGQFLFAYAVPGPEGRELNGQRFRWTFDRARQSLAVQEADEMPAGAAQERVGRTEMDKLLDLVELGEVGYEVQRKAGVGVLTEGLRPSTDSALRSETAPGGLPARSRPTEPVPQPKGRVPGVLGPSAAGGARASGLAGQPGAEEEVARPSEPAIPQKPVREASSGRASPRAQPSDMEEGQPLAKESAEEPDGRPSPVREEGERRFAEAEEPRQPGPLFPAEEPGRYVRTYRVRFEFHAVDGPGGVAASIAKDAAAAGMIKEPPMAAEAAEEPPAAAATTGAPGPP